MALVRARGRVVRGMAMARDKPMHLVFLRKRKRLTDTEHVVL